MNQVSGIKKFSQGFVAGFDFNFILETRENSGVKRLGKVSARAGCLSPFDEQAERRCAFFAHAREQFFRSRDVLRDQRIGEIFQGCIERPLKAGFCGKNPAQALD